MIYYFTGDYFLISGIFVWKLKELDNCYAKQSGYPKRVSDVFQQATGQTNAMFRVGSYIYIIHDGDKISNYYNDGSTLYVVKGRQNLASTLGKDGVFVDKTIRSAFNHDGKTILIADDLSSFYQVNKYFC